MLHHETPTLDIVYSLKIFNKNQKLSMIYRPQPIYSQYFLFFPIFLPTNYQCCMSYRSTPIHDILMIYRDILNIGVNRLFKNTFHLIVKYFFLAICFWMICQTLLCFTPFLPIRVVDTLLQKWNPSSLTIALGTSNRVKMFLCRNLVMVLASFFGVAIASTHFDT